MEEQDTRPSSGLSGLDKILRGILPGDNIVWQVDDVDDYRDFVRPFCRFASDTGRKLIYFRFASHPQLMNGEYGEEICRLDPVDGFENFIDTIHETIERAGRGAYYVFDCLSELAGDWYSDQMLGNFFMLTCPYLYDLETITYFALLRGRHSSRAVGPISETTQLLLDDIRHDGVHYVRPIKVLHRYSPTMNMLHSWEGDEFRPVMSSATIADIQTTVAWTGLGPGQTLGFRDRVMLDAERAMEDIAAGRIEPSEADPHFDRLARMFLSRYEDILQLAAQHLELRDVLDIGRRMIGTGLIGGKAAGMLLARAILKHADPRFVSLLEEHDSFFIGSDVFYTFLVQNGIWWVREKQRDPDTFLQDAEQARRRILTGKFPDYILAQLEDMLEYFGQSPFIVRSSSLLEDNFGNSFAGKYESVFCTNQGPKVRRFEDFLAAIRTIYASTMSEKALRYREQKGILEQDEQMALLVMRVSGSLRGSHFYPAAAGVGFSFNPYVWNEHIDPTAGVARVVFGLGTRAVDRSDDDYTRVVALNAPMRRPESNFEAVQQYAQRRVDYLDLEANQLVSGKFEDLASECGDLPMEKFASVDRRDYANTRSRKPPPPVLTFDGLLSNTPFVQDIREILARLAKAYDNPVDIEFTCNFLGPDRYKLNLVQCRPLQVQGSEVTAMPELRAKDEDCIIRARGAVIGQSRVIPIRRLVYVAPPAYDALPQRDRYTVATVIAKINRLLPRSEAVNTFMIGPGRWGTSTPSLGIPIPFAGINQATAVCEVVAMRDDLVPDVSLGTHFLNELIEMDMLYLALFPNEGGNHVNTDFFESAPNSIDELLPDGARWQETIKVIDASSLPPSQSSIVLHADAREQLVACYFATP